jgi:hypothetical protein
VSYSQTLLVMVRHRAQGCLPSQFVFVLRQGTQAWFVEVLRDEPARGGLGLTRASAGVDEALLLVGLGGAGARLGKRLLLCISA